MKIKPWMGWTSLAATVAVIVLATGVFIDLKAAAIVAFMFLTWALIYATVWLLCEAYK
jgi:hypothetical protein